MAADRFDAEALVGSLWNDACPHKGGVALDCGECVEAALTKVYAAGRAEERATWQRELIGGDLFVLRGYGPVECAKVLKEAGRAEALRDLGTLGFVFDLGLRETIGAMKYCPDHGSAKVEAVVWGKRRGWCANHNPFVIRALLTESEPEPSR